MTIHSKFQDDKVYLTVDVISFDHTNSGDFTMEYIKYNSKTPIEYDIVFNRKISLVDEYALKAINQLYDLALKQNPDMEFSIYCSFKLSMYLKNQIKWMANKDIVHFHNDIHDIDNALAGDFKY